MLILATGQVDFNHLSNGSKSIGDQVPQLKGLTLDPQLPETPYCSYSYSNALTELSNEEVLTIVNQLTKETQCNLRTS